MMTPPSMSTNILRAARGLLSQRIFSVLFVANCCLLAGELKLLCVSSRSQVLLLFFNFAFLSSLIASHFDSHNKLYSLHSTATAAFQKLSFQDEAHNLLCAAASIVVGILLANVVSSLWQIAGRFFSLLSLGLSAAIAWRWTRAPWKARCLTVVKHTLFSYSPESVYFATVLFADILTTFSRPVSSASHSSRLVRAVIFSAPYLIRVKQCLIEAASRSSKAVSMANTLKYAGLMVACAVLSMRSHLHSAFMLVPVVAIGYACWWDAFMDWGTCSWTFVLLNVILRFLPLVAAVSPPSLLLTPFVYNALEVYRRSVWIVLRLRHHHRAI